MKFTITDRQGWTRDYSINKSIAHIGSDTHNEIVLDANRGSGVAARHVQVLNPPNGSGSARLINLSDMDIPLGDSGLDVLAPRCIKELTPGLMFRLGEFTIQVDSISHGEPHSAISAASATSTQSFAILQTEGVAMSASQINSNGRSSKNGYANGNGNGHINGSGQKNGKIQSGVIAVPAGRIGVQLALLSSDLSVDRCIEGTVLLRNNGDRTGVQFKIDIQGLPRDCYELEPGPVLFPGAGKELALRIFHPRTAALSAGNHMLTVRAAAPEAYPGEMGAAAQVVRVLPYYAHTIRLLTTSELTGELN